MMFLIFHAKCKSKITPKHTRMLKKNVEIWLPKYFEEENAPDLVLSEDGKDVNGDRAHKKF